MWHKSWLKLADEIPAKHTDSPADMLSRFTEVHCDPDVILRLAFLEASHKPSTQAELAKDNKRQQRIKRKLGQSRSHLWKAMGTLAQVTQSIPAKDNKGQRHIERKVSQYRKHVLKAALELEQAFFGRRPHLHQTRGHRFIESIGRHGQTR